MLFDLQGKRKRFVQVIYAGLALLIGGGLVFFGIGGAGGGGLLDAVGIGSDTTQSSNYDEQIDKANETLSSNPNDERALLVLARYEFLKGQEQREVADNGSYQLTEGTINSYENAADAWERYVKTKPKELNDDVAGLMVQVYPILYSVDTAQQEQILDNLVTAAKIVAEARPALGTYQNLATFAYYAQDQQVADEAAKKAIAEAPDPTTRKQLQQAFKQAQKQAELAAKQQKQQQNAAGQAGTGTLPDPTAALGGSSGIAPAP